MAAMAEIFSPQLSPDTGYDHRGYPAQYPPEAYEVIRRAVVDRVHAF